MIANTAETKTQPPEHEPQVIKAFAALPVGLMQCLGCGEIFAQETAPDHAEVDCYPSIEFCLLDSSAAGTSNAPRHLSDALLKKRR
jgi:hypothetical protein